MHPPLYLTFKKLLQEHMVVDHRAYSNGLAAEQVLQKRSALFPLVHQ